jgi:hypothetical protein
MAPAWVTPIERPLRRSVHLQSPGQAFIQLTNKEFIFRNS